MKKYDRVLKMYFFERLQQEELDLIKKYFYDKSESRYNEVSNEYIFGDKLKNLINKGIVKPYIQKKIMKNKSGLLYLLDCEVKSKLNNQINKK